MTKFRYSPMLRTKTGEVSALEQMPTADKRVLYPVMHVVTQPPAGFVQAMAASWSGFPLALDGQFSTVETGGPATFKSMFVGLGKAGIPIVPSIEANAPAIYLNAAVPLVGRFAPGLVVKAKLGDLANLPAWIAAQGWKPSEVDLVVSLESIAGFDISSFGDYVAHRLVQNLPAPMGWRSITLSASAAPKDLGGLQTGRTNVPRVDWQLWQSVSNTVPWTINGDYGTAHPDLIDPPGFAMARATVSVRYTTDDKLIVLKGRPIGGAKGQPMGLQYQSHAKALATDSEFGGLVGCWGDDRIKQIVAGSLGPGNRTTWVSIGMSRHLTLTAQKLP